MQGSSFPVANSIHHPGVRAKCCLIAARFCWPQMAKAITLMARACLFCQRGKVHKHVHLQPAEIPVPHRCFAHIHVDLVGLLPPSRRHIYLFTIIDRTSRWPEAIPLSSITSTDCARALFSATGDLQPSTDIATNNNIHVNALPPNRVNLLACRRRVWGDLWWCTVCSRCVSRLDHHETYYTSHMLYICTYSPSVLWNRNRRNHNWEPELEPEP